MLPLQLKSAKAGTENAINVESKNFFNRTALNKSHNCYRTDINCSVVMFLHFLF